MKTAWLLFKNLLFTLVVPGFVAGWVRVLISWLIALFWMGVLMP